MDSVQNVTEKLRMQRLSEDVKEECTLDDVVKLIVLISAKTNCENLTRTKALLIYHQFKRCIGDFEYENFIVAGACVNISIKWNEELIGLKAVILVICEITGKEPHVLIQELVEDEIQNETENNFKHLPEHKIEILSNSIGLMESLILRMTEFSLDHPLAHEYLVYFMNDFRENFVHSGTWDLLLETTLKLASDFYLTKHCLSFKGEDIALIVIEFSLHMNQLPIESSTTEKWFQCFNKVSLSIRMEIWEHIYKMGIISPTC